MSKILDVGSSEDFLWGGLTKEDKEINFNLKKALESQEPLLFSRIFPAANFYPHISLNTQFPICQRP
jgi:hypothetical protein